MKPQASGIWIGAGSSALGPESRDLLSQVGLDEVFYEAGMVSWDNGSAEIASQFDERLSQSLPVTLVVRGDLPPSASDSAQQVESLLAELRALDLEAKAARLLPIGFHLDLGDGGEGTEALDSYLELLRGLRKGVGEETFLSVSVFPDWLDQETGRAIAGVADFVVAFLYGQDAEGDEDPALWSFLEVGKRMDQLAEQGVEYLLGVKTLGLARLRDRRGNGLGASSEAAIRDLVDARDFERPVAGGLDLLDRQSVVYQATRNTRFGGWRVSGGQTIELSRPTTWHLRQLHRLAVERSETGCLGLIVHRLAGPFEDLALSVGNMALAVIDEPIEPVLAIDVSFVRRTGNGAVVRVGLRNASEETTDLGGVETNFVQLRIDDNRGYFSSVQSGDFPRYRLFRDGESEIASGRWRRPDELRLFTPFVGAGDSASSGDIVLISADRNPTVTVTGRFVLPGGTVLELDVLRGTLSELAAAGSDS